jgi:hypothetical protein
MSVELTILPFSGGREGERIDRRSDLSSIPRSSSQIRPSSRTQKSASFMRGLPPPHAAPQARQEPVILRRSVAMRRTASTMKPVRRSSNRFATKFAGYTNTSPVPSAATTPRSVP